MNLDTILKFAFVAALAYWVIDGLVLARRRRAQAAAGEQVDDTGLLTLSQFVAPVVGGLLLLGVIYKLDFALLLLVLSAYTGLVWLLDKLFFAKARKLMVKDGEEVHEPVLVDYSRSLFPVLFFVLALRSFVAEPFRIPSESMMPNLLVGDFILVNKFDYGLRLPVANTKLVARSEPKRGDVIVFRYPGKYPGDPEAGTDYIKRVIGLPGDTIEVVDDRVTINGTPVEYQADGIFVGTGSALDNSGTDIVQEKLPGRSHTVLNEPGSPFGPGSWVVPAGHYFAMGDNRDHSADSRDWGMVPEENLVGRAMIIWLNCEGWFCSNGFNYSRVGDTIH